MADVKSLPETITHLLTQHQSPEWLLNQLVEAVGKGLNADRCFLYVRQPAQQRGRIAICWRKNETIPAVIQPDWQDDTTSLPQEDPLFRAAITLKPSVYVDDVETAGPEVLNREFERKTSGIGHSFMRIVRGMASFGEFYNRVCSVNPGTGPQPTKRT